MHKKFSFLTLLLLCLCLSSAGLAEVVSMTGSPDASAAGSRVVSTEKEAAPAAEEDASSAGSRVVSVNEEASPAESQVGSVGETPSAEDSPSASAEEDASPTDSQVVTASPDELVLPKVIDRINFPGAYPGFSFSGEDDLLEIWFPPIRDQDAAIFLYQGQVWMLDCGDERAADETVPLLRYLGIKKIDRLINTHPHHDHLNGLYAIDAYCPISELSICFPEDATVHMTAAMEYCKGNGISISRFEDESILRMGDGAVSFLAWMKTDEQESMNDRSAQFMIEYGACSMLSMADMELRGQRQLYDALDPALLKADILRYPHHGKNYIIRDLFPAIDPALSIITNSIRIDDIKESTKFLDNRHALAAYTGMADAVLHLTTDGVHWLCEEVPFNPRLYLPDPEEAKPGTSVIRTGAAPGSGSSETDSGSDETAEPAPTDSGSVISTEPRNP